MTAVEHEGEIRRLEAESDAAIAEYQRTLADMQPRCEGRVMCRWDEEANPWYFEPPPVGDEGQAPAHVYLDYGIAVEVDTAMAPTIRMGERAALPGSFLLRLIAWFPGSKHLLKDLEPVVADMRAERNEALAAGDKAGARRILVQGYLDVLRGIVPSWLTTAANAIVRWIGRGPGKSA